MKRTPFLAVLFLGLSLTAYGQLRVTCPQPKFKPPADQYRGAVKHRDKGANSGKPITVADVYALPNVDVAVVNSDANSDRAMSGSAEEDTFTLDALLRQAKVEGNDCEIHLEF